MNQWDIVDILFPLPGFKKYVKQTGVIISEDSHNKSGYVIMAITHRKPSELLDFRLSKEHKEFKATGLSMDSTFKPSKLVTMDDSMIDDVRGSVGPEIQAEIKKRLKTLFSL